MADLPEPPIPSPAATPSPGAADPAAPDATTGAAGEVEVGLAAFLPEGVVIGDDDSTADDEPVDDEPPAEGPVDDGHADDEPVDDEPADDGPAGGDRPSGDDGIDLALLGELEADLDAVGLALAALDDGSYGSCAVCGSPLTAEVLAADPVRRTCDAHLPAIG